MSAVLVVGGATGIGAAVVRALLARGDTVVLADRNVTAGEQLISEQAPGRGYFVPCDLSNPTSAHQIVAQAGAFTDGRLDALFYNAAVLTAHPLREWTVTAWDHAIAVNLRAPFFTVQAATPLLQQATDGGRIVLTASTGALRGHAGMPAYHASKTGMLGLTRALADELGPLGITINALCPGWVDTPFNAQFWQHQPDTAAARSTLEAHIPLRRQGTPEDIVGSVLYLMSDAARYVTGQTLVVDGGYTAV